MTIPVGTVIYSILPPKAINKNQINPEWVLLDGRVVDPDWKLSKLLDWKSLPNAANHFIRSITSEEAERKIGSYEDMATARPKTEEFKGYVNPVVNSNSSDAGDRAMLEGAVDHLVYTDTNMNGKTFPPSHKMVADPITTLKGGPRTNSRLSSAISGGHGHGNKVHPAVFINKGGDDETRPINIALYTYIKVN